MPLYNDTLVSGVTIGRSGLAAILRTIKNQIHGTVENLYRSYSGEDVSGMTNREKMGKRFGFHFDALTQKFSHRD